MNKLFLASALTSSLILTGCGSSASDTANNVVSNATATVSGTITNDSAAPSAPLPGVKVECIYTGSLPCSSSTTDTSGNYSVTLLRNTDFYLSATLATYITVNSAVMTASTNDSGNDIGLMLTDDAQLLVRTAFNNLALTISSAAWLVVDVVDASGNRLTGEVVNENIGAGTGNTVYPNCVDATPGATATTACPPGGGDAPAYIAKYSTADEVTVTVGTQTQRGFLVTGEVLYMEFTQ